jgi:putative peptidoglycan lipid II flippase
MKSLMSGLVRSNLVVAGGTAVSRLTGLARIVVFGVVVGQTALADAFEAANNSPNAIYELLLGGVFSASLVPLFVGLLNADDEESGKRNVSAVFSTSLVVLIGATILAVIAAPWIFRLFSLSPAATVDVETFRTAGTMLTRILVVQVLFYGIIALTSAMLNARSHFFAAAWSPSLANLVAIALFLAVPLTGADNPPSLADAIGIPATLWTLGLSTTLGVAAIALVQVFAVRRLGIALSFAPSFGNESVRRLLRLSTWTVGYVVANQVAVVVVKNLASPGSGLVDAYGKAFVLFQLPHGLLAVSIATTFVPVLARHHQSGQHDAFGERLSDGIRFTVLLSLPASIIAIVFSAPIVQVVLGYGNFDTTAVANTSRALTGLAVGLVGFSVYLFALRGFFATGNTRTPFVINLLENAMNIVLAFLLVNRFDVLGLGLAFGIAYLFGAFVAIGFLARAMPTWHPRALVAPLLRYTIAGTAMFAASSILSRALDTTGTMGSIVAIVIGSSAGLIAFVLVLLVTRDGDLRRIIARFYGARTTRSSR